LFLSWFLPVEASIYQKGAKLFCLGCLGKATLLLLQTQFSIMLNEVHVLYFPNAERLADFVIENNVGHLTVNTPACSITGKVPQRLIYLARFHYEARVDTFTFLSPSY
jgi:hypothetical protein